VQKAHIGQVDYLRVFGLTTIVIIHSLGFFFSLSVFGPFSHDMQGLALNLLRYGRFIFMFVTGLVFFYNYQDKAINLTRFYKRRFNNLVLPYIIWTAFYLLLSKSSMLVHWESIGGFLVLWWQNIFSGNAFYHLYYIVVSIEFYLIFPLLVRIFKPRKKRLWVALIMLCGLAISIPYHYILEDRASLILSITDGTVWHAFAAWLIQRKNHMLVSYLPFYLLGGMAGLYWKEACQWVKEHKNLIIALFAVGAVWAGGDYLYSLKKLGMSFTLSASIFRPGMYFYSLASIGLFLIFAIAMDAKGILRPLVKLLSGNSFGIYLIHPVVLFGLHTVYYWLNLPMAMMLPIDWALAVALSCLISQLIGSSKYTGYIVGSFGNRNFRKTSWSHILEKAKSIIVGRVKTNSYRL
jgi:peptidoglycan/LPS O-acetylase OafA/YrhL